MSLDDARQRLRSRYIDGLRSRREALELLLAALYEDPESAVDALRHEASELRRSAQDYGFGGLSQVAGRVETCSDDQLDVRVRDLLDALDGAADDPSTAPLVPVRRDVLGSSELRQHFAVVAADAMRRGASLATVWVGTSDALAAQIRKLLRDSDVVGRLEVGVLIVLPNTGLAGAGKLLERLASTGKVRALGVPALLAPEEELDQLLERMRATRP